VPFLPVLTAKLLALCPFVMIGLVVEAAASRRRVPAQSAGVNLIVLVIHAAASVAITSTVTIAAINVALRLPRPTWLPTPSTGTWSADLAWTMAMLVFLDFLYYWMHRAQHAWPILWAQHAVHHSDEHYNVTTAWRMHWTEPLLETVFMVLPTAYVFVQAPRLAVAISIASDALTAFVHLNVPWRCRWLQWFINTPPYHRTHHSICSVHVDRNYAAKFPVWDRLFRTYVEPASDTPTGLRSGDRVQTAWAANWLPIVLLRRRWMRAGRAEEQTERQH
jgi:sterol desaturase/sphingolipid hydroxylase (fatty acid hydroxylase superfamily)